MEKIALGIKLWIKKNPTEFVFLLIIILLAAFLRLYRISEYMTFLGDEGRDVIIVRRLLVNADPILIGPGTSIGNMYLGPLYYYFMAPWLFLFGLSPVGPAVGIAILGVATVFLIWHITREFFGQPAAWVASALYAVSPVVITYSKSSWNPNIMPFFALLCIYLIWSVYAKASAGRGKFWLIIFGVSFAFVLQSHYLGLLLLPTILLFWLLSLLKVQHSLKREFLRYSFVGLLLFTILM